MKKLVSIICIIIVLTGMTLPVYAAGKDTKAPAVTKTSPAEKATDIMIESTIVVRFSEAIKKGKTFKKITLKEANQKSAAFTCEIKDNLLIITPTADLKYNSGYTLTLPAAAVKDAAGNNLKKACTLSFITEEKPSEAADTKETGKKYKLEIEANLDTEFTKEMQSYLVQYLKMLGIDAKITKVEAVE